jgi:hypothetical protein
MWAPAAEMHDPGAHFARHGGWHAGTLTEHPQRSPWLRPAAQPAAHEHARTAHRRRGRPGVHALVGRLRARAQLIYQRAGISLHAGKQAMVYSRLSRRLRETGHRSLCDYLQAGWKAPPAPRRAEWQEFVNCLTTNLTAFFREEHHFHALVEDLRARAAARCASGATPPPPAKSPTRWP